eukprot:185192-Amphidinium_carterae.1
MEDNIGPKQKWIHGSQDTHSNPYYDRTMSIAPSHVIRCIVCGSSVSGFERPVPQVSKSRRAVSGGIDAWRQFWWSSDAETCHCAHAPPKLKA